MSVDNLCDHGGWLVSDQHSIPKDDFEYVWAGGVLPRGCNHLLCRRCELPVRNEPGYYPAAGTRPNLAALYDLPDWDAASNDWVASNPGWRLYVCKCEIFAVDRIHALGNLDDFEVDEEPPPWSCGGHPRIILPGVVDGIRVVEGDIDTLIEIALAGQYDTLVPAYLSDRAGGWLLRLYALLSPSAVADNLSIEVAAGLGSSHDSVRSRAAHFFELNWESSGAERIAEVLHSHPDRFLDQTDPLSPRKTLGEPMLEVLARRIVAPNCVRPSELAVAREASLAVSKVPYVMVQSLVRADRSWVLSHLADLLRAEPTRHALVTLLRQLTMTTSADLVAPLVDLSHEGILDPIDVQELVLKCVAEPERTQITSQL